MPLEPFGGSGGGGGSVTKASVIGTGLAPSDIGGVAAANNGTDFADAGSTRANIHIPVLTPCACVSTVSTPTLSGAGGATTIASGSNSVGLPQATINVAATASFPAAGTINVVTGSGTQAVSYTGTTSTTFTGCTGGTGTMSTGGAVTATFDAYLLAAGDTILLTAQSPASLNGPWMIPAGVSGAWTRPTDFTTTTTVKGRTVRVINGTVNSGTDWTLIAPNAGVVIGTTAQTWTNTFDVRYVTASQLAATPITITGTGAPGSNTGLNGDIYLDQSTGNLWGPKSAGAWPGSAAATLVLQTAGDTRYQPSLPVPSTVTTGAALVVNKLTPVDATSGAITMTLPTPTILGQQVGAEKIDATTNTVTVTGTIRGVSTSLTLTLPNENVVLEAESLSSWRTLYSHKTLGSLDSRYGNTVNYVRSRVGWNVGWKAALASISTTPVGILFNGDSITGGVSITAGLDPLINAFPDLVLTGLLSKYGVSRYGDGYSPYQYTSGTGLGGVGADIALPFAAATLGNQVDEAAFGRAINNTVTTAGTFASMTFTGTGCDIVMASSIPTVTVAITVDGAALPGGATATGTGVSYASPTITYTNHGPNSQQNVPIDKILIRGLANTSHTVTIANPATAHAAIFCWFNTYYGGTGGFMACRNGSSGCLQIDMIAINSASNWNSRWSLPVNRDRLWSGGAAGTNGTQGVWLSSNPFGFPTGCQLIIQEKGVNDVTNGASVAQYRAAMTREFRAMRRASPNCSIVVLLPCYSDGVTSDSISNTRAPSYPRYKEAAYQVADDFNALVIDIDAKWGPNSVTNGFQNSGNIHPTSTGHADIANTILSML